MMKTGPAERRNPWGGDVAIEAGPEKKRSDMSKIFEQKINGRVAERLTINSDSGMATIEKIGLGVSETFGAGDGKVAQFIRSAESAKSRSRRIKELVEDEGWSRSEAAKLVDGGY
jgi:hypothetical protein